MSRFDSLLELIEPLEKGEHGRWISDSDHKGTMDDPIPMPFCSYSEAVHKLADAVYEFVESNPEYELKNYQKLLEDRGLKWSMDSFREADVSIMDAQGILAMLVGLLRAERFSDGVVLEALESGLVLKWLERIRDIVEKR